MIGKLLYVWFSFRGNLSRSKYLLWYVIPIAALLGVMFLIGVSFGTPTYDNESGEVRFVIQRGDNIIVEIIFGVLFFISFVGASWGLIASGIKRLHDMCARGWWIIIILIPLINLILFGALIFVPSKTSPAVADRRADRE